MTIKFDDKWVWDSWPLDADGRHHLFYLQADRALIDPHARHMNPSIGHAVSDDYRHWEILPDVIAPRETPGWDDATTWTGSVVQGPSGTYHLFYTGASKSENALVQRIGRADSHDLITWERFGDQALVEADPRWYEKYTGPEAWHDEAWRDPWVFPDADGGGWHMLITARANHGERMGRGVVGHAWSPDLTTWEVRPPLSAPSKFGQLEVIQYVEIDGVPHLAFCTGAGELHPALHPEGQRGGMWLVAGTGPLGPWDIDAARRVDHDSLYAARVITDVDGTPALLGFADMEDGHFVGEILDPVPIRYE